MQDEQHADLAFARVAEHRAVNVERPLLRAARGDLGLGGLLRGEYAVDEALKLGVAPLKAMSFSRS